MKFGHSSFVKTWIHSQSHPIHPWFDGNTAGQSGVYLKVTYCFLQTLNLLLTHTPRLLVHSVEPVIFHNYSAISALWPVTERIVRSVVWTISRIVPVTNIILKALHLHSHDCFQKRFSLKGWYFFIYTVSVLDEKVYPGKLSQTGTFYFMLSQGTLARGRDDQHWNWTWTGSTVGKLWFFLSFALND
jgi:hypothetical protein